MHSLAPSSSSLTPELRASLKEQFDAVGYCIADDLFNAEELQEIEDFFEEFKRVGGRNFFNGDKNYEDIDPAQEQIRAMKPHRFSQKIMDYFTHPKVAEVLELLLEKPPLGVQSMYYYKPPGTKGQGMHQDNFYLRAAPATCIAAWTPIDDSTLENGCLYVVPGSNRGNMICPEKDNEERWMNYGDSHISKFPRDTKPVPVPVNRGQTLFFGGTLIHGSGPNRTKDRWRRTFIGHYIDEATELVSGFYHPVINMKQEVISTVKINEGGGPCGDGFSGQVH